MRKKSGTLLTTLVKLHSFSVKSEGLSIETAVKQHSLRKRILLTWSSCHSQKVVGGSKSPLDTTYTRLLLLTLCVEVMSVYALF